MIAILFAAQACAGEPEATKPEVGEKEAVGAEDSLVPSEDEIKEGLEAAGDPAVVAVQDEAMRYIEHFHGKDQVERYRQQLIDEKAAEIKRQLEEQEEAEKRAKAEAIEQAQEETKELKAKVIDSDKVDE